jgi:hypothetical protein
MQEKRSKNGTTTLFVSLRSATRVAYHRIWWIELRGLEARGEKNLAADKRIDKARAVAENDGVDLRTNNLWRTV